VFLLNEETIGESRVTFRIPNGFDTYALQLTFFS